MHVAIAALSNCVPAIVIAYSHKAKGIFSGLGLANLVVNIEDLDWKITDKIKTTLINQEAIKKKLKVKIIHAQKLAKKPSFKVAKIINQK